MKKNVDSYFFIWQVQSDHFHEIFAPELDKHGYQALYKRKTNEVRFMDSRSSLPLMLENLLTVTYFVGRFSAEVQVQLMDVQRFSEGIDLHMSRNMMFVSVLLYVYSLYLILILILI